MIAGQSDYASIATAPDILPVSVLTEATIHLRMVSLNTTITPMIMSQMDITTMVMKIYLTLLSQILTDPMTLMKFCIMRAEAGFRFYHMSRSFANFTELEAAGIIALSL
jgi:hypothetical protein